MKILVTYTRNGNDYEREFTDYNEAVAFSSEKGGRVEEVPSNFDLED